MTHELGGRPRRTMAGEIGWARVDAEGKGAELLRDHRLVANWAATDREVESIAHQIHVLIREAHVHANVRGSVRKRVPASAEFIFNMTVQILNDYCIYREGGSQNMMAAMNTSQNQSISQPATKVRR